MRNLLHYKSIMTFKFIFFLTIYSSVAHCCSVLRIDGTDSHLQLANTIILGTVISNDKEQYFISQKPWPTIKLNVSKKCGGFKLRSGDMVFSSKKTISELINNTKSIHMGNGSFGNLKTFSHDVNDIIDKEELPEGQPNHFWKYCTQDSNCISTVGRCGERFSINKDNLIRFENYLKKKDYICSESPAHKASTCIKNFCS